eukprot:scaffold27132_cov183-Skeletonema_menzelii.AAC.1
MENANVPHYIHALKEVANSMNEPLFGWSYHDRRAIYCFAQQRLAASTLVEASLHFLRAKPANGPTSRSYFMWLLSCLQSMILFDNYSGNKASYSVIFGDDLKSGVLAKLLRNRHQSRSSSFTSKLDYFQVRNGAKNHLKEIERNLTLIAKRVQAHNNGINFAIKIKASDNAAVSRVLWPVDSNYKEGTEYMMFKELNGGCFPTSKKVWIKLIKINVIPKFLGFSGPEEIDEAGQRYMDYSISEIKKMK